MKYALAVCGGTFDHFHKGHASFLEAALSVSGHLLIGITSDAYVASHKEHSAIQSFTERKQSVMTFLREKQLLDRVTIASIDTVSYPKEWELLPIQAIIVTKETQKGADLINRDRKAKRLPVLEVYVIPFVPDDTGEKIASTNIREGKINQDGVSYVQPQWFAHDLFLPEIEKQWFKEPFGELHTDTRFLYNENPQKLVAVGDVVTGDCNKLSIGQKLSIIDFTVQRKDTFHHIQELGFSGNEKTFQAINPASHITTSLFKSILQAIDLFEQEKQLVIIVDGEEDLAVIPLVLALPLGFIIIYGQPHKGLVRLPVTSETKGKAYHLLQRFITHA